MSHVQGMSGKSVSRTLSNTAQLSGRPDCTVSVRIITRSFLLHKKGSVCLVANISIWKLLRTIKTSGILDGGVVWAKEGILLTASDALLTASDVLLTANDVLLTASDSLLAANDVLLTDGDVICTKKKE